jgi:hypothetical protein
MSTTTYASGISVTTFPPPPVGFDVTRATDKDRELYGLPRFSASSTEFRKRWEECASKVRFIEPEFEPREIRRKQLPSFNSRHDPTVASNWSGVVTFPAKGDRIWGVTGNWRLPRALPPNGAKGGVTYAASSWVGIDGDFGSKEVLQAGCDADAKLSGGHPENKMSPWWEWYPKDSFWIKNMDAQVDDEFTCFIQCPALFFGESPSSATSATIFLANLTAGVGAVFLAKAPHHMNLQGNCAEWIVEALETGPHGALELAQFTPVNFSQCAAFFGAEQIALPDTGTTLNISESNGAVLAQGEKVGTDAVSVVYV